MTDPEKQSAPRRRGLRFGSKLVMILLALVLTVLLSMWAAVELAIEGAVDAQLHRELEVGERVWNETHLTRLEQMIDRVAVLAEDFGFRQAITSTDPPTVLSALANAGNRLAAPYQLAMDVDGRVLAANLPEGVQAPTELLDALRAEAHRQGFAAGVVGVQGRPLQLALVPVFAPDLVAWVAMAQPLELRELEAFRSITGIDAGILVGSPCQASMALGSLAGWAPDAQPCADAIQSEDSLEVQRIQTGRSLPVKLLKLSFEQGTPVILALAATPDAALAPFIGLRRNIVELSLLAALLTALLAWQVGRRVSRPLQEVGDAAARIVEGDYSRSVVVRGNDELAELAQAFNRMQQGIELREQQILFQAGHDMLTGLPNRERALLSLNRMLQAEPESGSVGAVALVDIRRFRQINDLFGHSFGDQLLMAVAERLDGAVREGDVVSRWGGNEFLLILRGVTAQGLVARAERLVEQMHAPLDLGGTPLQLEVCIGLAPFPDGATEAATLARRADVALNEAKASDDNFRCYEKGHDEQHLRQLRLIGDLRRAIERHELALVYQPKVDLIDQAVHHAEVLIRWNHPELGRVPPDEFIPLAERAGLIRAITAHVLDQALAQVARWRTQDIRCGVAVNLSAIDLADVQIVDTVLDALKRHRVPPQELILEVTESAMMRELDAALDAMHRLKRSGLRFSIDDFGTGHSSLAQLKRLPVDELKIDKSFVTDLLPGTEDERIVHSIVELAHAMSLRVVAEGVESADGRDILHRLGCETAQGYLYSKPLAAEDFAGWISQQRDRVAAA